LKDRVLFFAMIGVIVLLTFIHKVEIFLFLAIVFIFFSYKIAIKSLWAILFFNLSITLGYIFQSFFTGKDVFDYLILFNLRVFDITFLVLYVTSKINIIKAVSFSKSLRFLFSATLSQIDSFKRSFDDFIFALKSRSVKKLGERKKKEFISAMFYFFLQKALHNSKERSLALKARGFFD